MVVSDVEAVCRSEAQRVLTQLRGNRKYGNLSRGWRELEEGSPIRQLSEWRCSKEVKPTGLLEPLLRIVRSPEFAGPPTYVALEATQAVLQALCEGFEEARQTPSAAGDNATAGTLAEVCSAVCECVFEETHQQSDEATVMQMVSLLEYCAAVPLGSAEAAAFPAAARHRAFCKVLSIWEYYRSSHVLRACAQQALQSMLGVACADLPAHLEFLELVLDDMLRDVETGVASERAILHLRCLQRFTTHSAARRWSAAEGPLARLFQDAVPMILLRISAAFGSNITVLSLLLPVVNRICWLCVDRWLQVDGARSPCLGAMQVEALVSSTYLRPLVGAAAPLQSLQGDPVNLPMSWEEGTELLVVLLEGLSDLLQADTVRTLWLSFDADWRRPALLEQAVRCIADLYTDTPSTERQLPAHVVHLSTTVLTRVVAAWEAAPATTAEQGGERQQAAELADVQAQWERREVVEKFMQQVVDSPKKVRAAFEKSGLMEFIPTPPQTSDSCQEHEDWVQKLVWTFRCLNHAVPYAAMGEFFGQPKDDSKQVLAAFVETFDMGAADLSDSLRLLMEAFRLPGEAQQIDRVLQSFGDLYYRQQIEYRDASGREDAGYLRNSDAAYTLAFSVIMLNVDQHNPKLKKRMAVRDFISNNRQCNDGVDFPPEVLTRIFEDIQRHEIKTPPTGNLAEGLSAVRWRDYMKLIRKGYRDNALTSFSSRARTQGFLQRCGGLVRAALEHALATGVGASSDALEGLEHLWHLTLQHQSPEADSVAEALFFFGTEVFHEPQKASATSRAAACLRALFRTALAGVSSMSTRQVHMMVYLTVQFALYGLLDKALPPGDPLTQRLLRLPTLAVESPTGVVYSFLRKISAAPFKMLSYTEDGTAAPAPSPISSTGGAATAPSPISSTGATAGDTDKDPSGMQDSSTLGSRPTTAEDGAASSPPTSEPTDASAAGNMPSPPPSARGGGGDPDGEADQSSPGSAARDSPAAAAGATEVEAVSPDEEASLADNPLRPQIEVALGACGLGAFTSALALACRRREDRGGSDGEAASAQVLLSYLSALFLALRASGAALPKLAKDLEMPWWPEPPTIPRVGQPQGLQLPKRALALHVLDGYETLRLALRLTLLALREGGGPLGDEDAAPPSPRLWDPFAVQELAVCAHVGLYHMLRRPDLSERGLRACIAAIFQVGAVLLRLHHEDGFAVSVGWPVRLIGLLIRRCEGEPHVLVLAARLCVEATRAFVIEVARARVVDRSEVWQYMLNLLLKAMPTEARALWPGPMSREVETVQRDVWKRGLTWVLCHPHLLDCLGIEDGALALASDGAPAGEEAQGTAAADAKQGSAAFWAWVLPELATCAGEIAGSASRSVAFRLQLEAYGTMLLTMSSTPSVEEHALEGGESPASPTAPSMFEATRTVSTSSGLHDAIGSEVEGSASSSDSRRASVMVSSWARVAIHTLTVVGPCLSKGSAEDQEQIAPFLKMILLNVRVPLLFGAAEEGPYWCRLVLEKLATMLTNGINAGAPIIVVRDAVPPVAKFFLQNLHTLQRQERFGQLWLMVLRLMLLFAKRGSDDRDAELEEIALEALKNLLRVLLSMKILGFIPCKPSGAASAPAQSPEGSPRLEDQPVWWQMTWDCIEVFIPGFGEDFARSALPRAFASPAAAGGPQPAAPPPPEVQDAAAAVAAPEEAAQGASTAEPPREVVAEGAASAAAAAPEEEAAQGASTGVPAATAAPEEEAAAQGAGTGVPAATAAPEEDAAQGAGTGMHAAEPVAEVALAPAEAAPIEVNGKSYS